MERRPDPHDRRARQLFTTEKARELLQPMRARAAAVYEQVLAGMSEAEREALHEGLKTIIANLAAAEQGSGDDPDGDVRSNRQPAERKFA